MLCAKHNFRPYRTALGAEGSGMWTTGPQGGAEIGSGECPDPLQVPDPLPSPLVSVGEAAEVSRAAFPPPAGINTAWVAEAAGDPRRHWAASEASYPFSSP